MTAPTTPAPVRRHLGGNLVSGAVVLALVVLTALISLVWTPYDPIPVSPDERLLGPGGLHLLGTDLYGRDVLSLLMAGARITLLVGVSAVLVATLLGVPVGIWAGIRRGWVDAVLMRAVDVVLAFPALLLTIVFGAVWGASATTAAIALGIGAAPSFARVSRSGTLQVMAREYVLAARSANRGSWWIATRHVLPNISGLVIVQASVAFAIAVLAEAALSYLGFGTRPPTPSWGRMLQEGQSYLYDHPTLVLFPGLAIAVTVLGLNLLGDGLRDRFDPRSEARR
ncbi:ABC transporter permease [Pseudonocardia nematodicida]|uniref:ABC transporter permease n=1 Tax=Pseudonocardia nematodicida TaxID=1206997 RepID=A0ABV1KEP4_9PSEU